MTWARYLAATFAALCALPGTGYAAGDVHRFAVVVGSNHGIDGKQPLRYAYRDAESVANALASVGEFPIGQVSLLLDPDPAAVLSALDHALAKIRALGGDTLLLFYYSGHADQLALYPNGRALPLEQLRHRLEDKRAMARIGIIDACRGGGWTQTKGLTPEVPFEIKRPLAMESEGSVLIASSSGFESAHESETFEGSFFTHHFVAGLLGAADKSGDGEITATEAFRYARELTVRDTALLAPQPQHPSFDVHLRGRSDLTLARVASGPGTVTLHQTQGPLQILGASSGVALLELIAGKRSATVVIPSGRYLVVRRADTGNFSTELVVDPDKSISVDESNLRPTGQSGLASKGPEPSPVLAQAAPALVADEPLNSLSLETAFVPPKVLYLSYERSVSRYASVLFKPSLWTAFADETGYSQPKAFGMVGFGADVGVRFFPLGTGPQGLYVGAGGGLIFSTDRYVAFRGFDATLHAGYSALFYDRFSLSIGAGASYFRSSHHSEEDDGGPTGYNTFVPDVRLAAGAAF